MSHKHRPRVPHLIQPRKRISETQFQMFGRDRIGNIDSFRYALCQYDLAVFINGFACDVLPCELRQLCLDLGLYRRRQRGIVGNQHRTCQAIVFRLRQQIGRNVPRICRTVCHDKYLARSRDHIDRNRTVHLLLGFCHKRITRTDDLIHPRYTLCTVCQRGNCLCTADFIDLIHARDGCRRQNNGIDVAVAIRRCHHHDFTATRNTRGDRVHQHRGRICRRTARYVQTRTVQRYDLLTRHHTVFFVLNKTGTHLLFVKPTNVLRRLFEDLQKSGIHRGNRLFDLLRCDAE